MRLREEQKYVIGMGESKTPLALTKACNKFIHLDLISGEVEDKSTELSLIHIWTEGDSSDLYEN